MIMTFLHENNILSSLKVNKDFLLEKKMSLINNFLT